MPKLVLSLSFLSNQAYAFVNSQFKAKYNLVMYELYTLGWTSRHLSMRPKATHKLQHNREKDGVIKL